jgi:voltage-gated potassium channel
MTETDTTTDSQSHSLMVAARAIRPLDWLMLLLAIFSIALLTWETLADLPPETTRTVIRIDYIVCAIFLAEFLWRWRENGWVGDFPLKNWYEIIGMIPVAEPALRGFRLFRVIRIVVLLGRFGRAADRALGDEFTYRLVNHFSRGIIGAIKRPVTIAMLEEVSTVLQKGHYTQNVARALEANRETLTLTILENLRRDPQVGRLSRIPFYEDIVRTTANTSLRVVLEVLNDPRTDELVADILRENLAQIRAAILAKGGPGTGAP